jgi:hypothetical protein
MVSLIAFLSLSPSQVTAYGCLAIESISTLGEGYRMALRNDCKETVTAYVISIKGFAANGKSFSTDYVEDFWASVGLPTELSGPSYGDRGVIGGIRTAQLRTIEQRAAFRGVDVPVVSLSATADAVVFSDGRGAGNARFLASTFRKRSASTAEYSYWRDALEKAISAQPTAIAIQSVLFAALSSTRFERQPDPDTKAGSLSALLDIRSFLRQMIQRAETDPVATLRLTKGFFDAKASLTVADPVSKTQEN